MGCYRNCISRFDVLAGCDIARTDRDRIGYTGSQERQDRLTSKTRISRKTQNTKSIGVMSAGQRGDHRTKMSAWVESIVSDHVIRVFHLIVEWAAFGIESLAVATILGAVVILAVRRGTVRYLFQLDKAGGYENYRTQLGRALLLGLELMVAADIVRTVTFEPTVKNVLVLGLLVLIRTLLSWGMSLEIEGCWPWQVRAHSELATGRSRADLALEKEDAIRRKQ